MTTKAPIAQTPKELVWTLNRAKLYRYVPVTPPPEARHLVPLLLVFGLMNRTPILDLRPGHSLSNLDWGVPGLEDEASEIRRLRTRIYGESDSPDALDLALVAPPFVHSRKSGFKPAFLGRMMFHENQRSSSVIDAGRVASGNF